MFFCTFLFETESFFCCLVKGITLKILCVFVALKGITLKIHMLCFCCLVKGITHLIQLI